LALEFDLTILIKAFFVDRHAGIQYRVELVPLGVAQIQLDEPVNISVAVDLRRVQVSLQVMQLVRVGLLAEHRRAVVVAKDCLVAQQLR